MAGDPVELELANGGGVWLLDSVLSPWYPCKGCGLDVWRGCVPRHVGLSPACSKAADRLYRDLTAMRLGMS